MLSSVTHFKAADENPNMTLDRPTSRSAGALAKAVRIRTLHSFMTILRPEMIFINTSGPLHPKLPPTIGVPHKDGPASGNNNNYVTVYTMQIVLCQMAKQTQSSMISVNLFIVQKKNKRGIIWGRGARLEC